MPLTPEQQAELDRLRKIFVPLAEQAKRDAQRQGNMDKMNPQNKAGGGNIKDLENYVRQHQGEYGAKRVQRAADEIPNLERMYTQEALRNAFAGDLPQAMMTMNPAEFEKFATPIPRQVERLGTRHTRDRNEVSFKDYIKHLGKLEGGFDSVPRLEINKQNSLPFHHVAAHEGRHRSRALTKGKVEKSLVGLVPQMIDKKMTQEELINEMRAKLYGRPLVIPQSTYAGVNRRQIELPDYYAKGGKVKEPKKTVKAYKLFRVHKDHPGKLFPLFVDANTPVEMGKWVDAKEGEMKDGKVKSKIGNLAYRPGWHAGDLPIATHIGEKSVPSMTAPDRRPANHAWAEVEMPDDVDWQSEANKRGTNAQGKLVPVKAHITDQIPHGGHYRYKTNPNMTGNWLIGGSMKVNRVLTDKEVERINSAAGLSDLPRETPFSKKKFGFKSGGMVAPDEWMAEEHINYAKGGQVKNPFDYENANHVDTVAGIASKHKDFSSTPQAHHHLGEMLSTGNWKYIEDPRIQSAIKRAGHDSYYVQEKTGKHHHVINKAGGGNVQPSIAQMKMALSKKPTTIDLKNIGVNEAPNMAPKMFFAPDNQEHGIPAPGGVATPSGMPIGGIDMGRQAGMQLMPQGLPQQAPQAPQPPQGGAPAPQGAPAGQPPQGGMNGNILEMTPAGRALNALSPNQKPNMAKGGSLSVDDMKAEIAEKKTKKAKKPASNEEKRILVKAEGSGGVKGIVVPKHLIEGNPNAYAEGLKNMMEARAKVYGEEHREPLNLKKISDIHQQALQEHFSKPIEEQRKAEEEALNRLREAKFIKHNRDTLDESEKLDTVHHEYDEQGRSHVGYASKGIAGHALFPKGHGEDMNYEVLNTCPGQTTGCGGGVDANGIVDTKRGTCFAPNAESQYAAAVSRRAGHTIAKHDPAMTKDWIIAHTGSMRNAAEKADKNNQRMLFRPNVVDETDTTSRHVIRHLNEQRKQEEKPPIISNQYGKTNELHDPENGYFVTHSNIGPKVKHGQEITENIGRDKARVRNTITAVDNKGDFKNAQGNKTPPKGSYLVTDVKRGSPMSKKMEEHITHAKYWSTGREEHELTPEEKAEGPEGHFGGNGKPTTEDKAHYGHRTVNGKRFDYQRQHILHPRLVQVGHNDDGTPHMIPTDSRFMDEAFLPKNRFKTKNGKNAGHILMTTPTESTDNIGHQTTFTHNVSNKHIEHAKANKGEYEIDKPEDQIKAKGKEYVQPQAVNVPSTWKMADGGSVSVGRHRGFEDDDFHAFPEQNIIAQRHLAMRRGEDEAQEKYHSPKKSVKVHKNLDTMRLELTRK